MADKDVHRKIGQCDYRNCNNSRDDTGIKLFAFPLTYDPRYKVWVKNSGCDFLLKGKKALRKNASICGEHFDQNSFVSKSCLRLKNDAVPIPFCVKDDEEKLHSPIRDEIKDQEPTINDQLMDSRDAEKEFDKSRCVVNEQTWNCGITTTLKSPMIVPVDSLRKVKRIEIEEQILNSRKIVTVVRCKNPETCPANRITNIEGAKPRIHFHKVFVDKTNETKPSGSVTRLSTPVYNDCNSFLKQDNMNESQEQSCGNSRKDEAETNETTESVDKPKYMLKKYHINLSKTPQSEGEHESSTTSRYSETSEAKNSGYDWETIQKARAAAVSANAENIRNPKRRSSIDLIQEYYKTKDVKSYQKCVYINCNNTKLTTGTHLFRFPQVTDPRLTTWIKNTGLENDGLRRIFPKMHWSDEVHCEEGRDDPFHCTTFLRTVYIKSLASDEEPQVPTHLHLKLSSWVSRVEIMYTVKVLVVVALCATGTLAAPQRGGGGGGSEKDAVITSQQLEVNFDGNYVNNFETSNGISHQESGQPKQIDGETAVVSQGSSSHTAPDGTPIQLTWTADENGFQAQGAHIPTAPPIPPEILRALEWNAAHPEEDDGGQPNRPPARG